MTPVPQKPILTKPSRTARRAIPLLVLAVAALGALSCSRIGFAPDGDGRRADRIATRENAERVNAWPLLTKRGDHVEAMAGLMKFDLARGDWTVFPLAQYRDDPKALWVLAHLFGWTTEDRPPSETLYAAPLLSWRRTKPDAWDWSVLLAAGAGANRQGSHQRAVPLFFHTWRKRDGRDHWNVLLLGGGMRAENAGGRYLLPLFLQTWDEEEKMFLSPLLSQKEEKDAGWRNVGALFYNRSWDGEAVHESALWPLLHRWEDPEAAKRGFAAAPLFLWNREGEERTFLSPLTSHKTGEQRGWRNAGIFLFHRSWNRDAFSENWLWPVFRRWSDPADDAWGFRAFPLAYYEEGAREERWGVEPFTGGELRKNGERFKKINVLGPVFGRTSGADAMKGHVLWPIGTLWRDAETNETGHAVLPVYWYEKNASGLRLHSALVNTRRDAETGDGWLSAAGPLYLRRTDGEGRYEAALWPFLHRWNDAGNETGGHAALPLYYFRRDADGWRFHSALCNMAREAENGDGLLNVGGPLYYRSEQDGARYAAALWPLFHRWSDPAKEASGDAVLPLYWREKEGDVRRFFSLLCNASRNQETGDGILNVGGPLFFRRTEGDADYSSFLWPLLHRWDDAALEKRGDAVLPLYWRETAPKEHRFHSPLVNRKRDKETGDGFLNVGGALYHDWKEGDETLRFITPFLGERADESQRAALQWLFPLGHREVRGDRRETAVAHGLLATLKQTPESSEQTALLGTFRREHSEHRHEVESWPLFSHWKTRSSEKGSTWKDWQALLLAGGHRGTVLRGEEDWFQEPGEYEAFRLIPLIDGSKGPKASDWKVLWPLWRSERQAGEHDTVRRRLLWRAVDYERVGEAVTVDAFPFIAWDRSPDEEYAAFSFLGPVLSRTRAGDGVRWRLFGLAFGDDLDLRSGAGMETPEARAGQSAAQ